MQLSDQVEYIRKHRLLLNNNSRMIAGDILKKWDSVRRLSQMEQLKVDRLIESIKEVKEKQHVGTRQGQSDSAGRPQ